MHTSGGPEGTTFHHNGDYSGAVIFTASTVDRGATVDVAAPFTALARAATAATASAAHVAVRGNGGSFSCPYTDETYVVVVPTADLRSLVAGRVRSERITSLEQSADYSVERASVLEQLDTNELWSLARARRSPAGSPNPSTGADRRF